MNGSKVKQFRRQANEIARKATEAMADPITAALNNELITRQRVDAMEALLSRGFLGRFRWLLLGR